MTGPSTWSQWALALQLPPSPDHHRLFRSQLVTQLGQLSGDLTAVMCVVLHEVSHHRGRTLRHPGDAATALLWRRGMPMFLRDRLHYQLRYAHGVLERVENLALQVQRFLCAMSDVNNRAA